MLDQFGDLKVQIWLLGQFNLNGLAAVLDPMRAANRVLGKQGYEWEIITADGNAVTSTTGISVQPHKSLTDAPCRLPLFIVASYGARNIASTAQKQLIRQHATQRNTLVGIETGAWILAECGVLNGHPATTHWEYLAEFAERFPDVEQRDARYVISSDFRRITTSGSGPTLDFMLHLIRCRHGIQVAREVARLFIYDMPIPLDYRRCRCPTKPCSTRGLPPRWR